VQLAARGPRSKAAAFDLTFSAPKSVSVLFAIGDEGLARALVEAHEEAVDAALAYLERDACRVRRGHNGTRGEREADDPRAFPAGAGGARRRVRRGRLPAPDVAGAGSAAAYARRLREHGPGSRWPVDRARRDGDLRPCQGSRRSVRGDLRQAVRDRLPWAEWGPVRNGIAELVQVPENVRVEFSQRRRRILEREAELNAAGVAVGHAGRERIAYDTREPKREIAEPDWWQQVRARAAEHGLGRRRLDRLARLPPSRVRDRVSEQELVGRLLRPNGLTARRNTFYERDVVIALAEAQGQGAGADHVSTTVDKLLRSAEVVPVGFGLDRRYTTREVLEAEEQIVRQADQGRGRGTALIDEQELGRALERLPCQLSSEQREAVMAIVGSGNRIDALEALAGTGKTTCAAVLREVYERAGYRVVGAAPTGRAVRELKERAGISESRTLDAWSLKLSADPHVLSFARVIHGRARRQPAVLVIDEAGMAHTRVSAAVIERALAAGVKVVAVGGSGQLSSVQAGGWLAALSRRVGASKLREVMRQRDPREQCSLAKLHRGEPNDYLELKHSRGELRIFDGSLSSLEAEQALIERWTAARERHGEEQGSHDQPRQTAPRAAERARARDAPGTRSARRQRRDRRATLGTR